MGRPRTPLKVLEISGATKKNPGRYRGRRASEKLKLPPIGDPPAEWTIDADKNVRCKALLGIWEQIIAQDVLRVLNVSHRILVENTCHLMYKIRRASAGYGKATSGDYAQVKSNLAAMGMTPVDSAKVSEAVKVSDRGEVAAQRPGAGKWGELAG